MAPKHIAVVPARSGSRGIPGKNRILFDTTADFIDKAGFFSAVYVSTNDPAIIPLASRRKYHVRQRPDELAGPTAPIRPALMDVVTHFALDRHAYLWLFYLSFPWHKLEHFLRAKHMIEASSAGSMMLFLPAKTHPYYCWGQDPKTGRMFKFVDTDIVSRQQFPPAYSNHHYISVTKVSALADLNDNLIGPTTEPFFLDPAESEQIVDLNELADFEDWHRLHPAEYARWWHRLSPADRPAAAPVP
jgi:CMP-N,N'-diacetyllegionaminic acid synthase